MTKETIDFYKSAYPSGTRIKLISMGPDPFPLGAGTTGTVINVDDIGTIHVDWDNGRSLGLCPDADEFVKL